MLQKWKYDISLSILKEMDFNEKIKQNYKDLRSPQWGVKQSED